MNPVPVLRLLGLASLGLFLAVAFSPLPNAATRLLREPARLNPADAIVVLGGNLLGGGTLDESSLRRAVHGILLRQRGLAPLLVFSGQTFPEGPTEATVRARLARDLGIPPETILPVAGAHTTREEAARVGAALRPRGIRRILLVTDSQHLMRAGRLFENVGFEVLGAPVDDLPSDASNPGERLQLARRAVGEALARLYYRIAGYL